MMYRRAMADANENINNLKILSVALIIAFSMLSAYTNAQNSMNEQEASLENEVILIVYLSRTNNTEAVAKIIHQQVGGTLVELELVNPYPENYDEIVAQVARENETGYLPLLKTSFNIDQYDTVFIGFPTWGMQLPPPMKSFLHQYDLSGKTVIPFNTNAGYGVGSSFETVKELCLNSTILDGFSTKGGVERDGIYFVMEGEKRVEVQENVGEWLGEIGVKD